MKVYKTRVLYTMWSQRELNYFSVTFTRNWRVPIKIPFLFLTFMCFRHINIKPEALGFSPFYIQSMRILILEKTDGLFTWEYLHRNFLTKQQAMVLSNERTILRWQQQLTAYIKNPFNAILLFRKYSMIPLLT